MCICHKCESSDIIVRTQTERITLNCVTRNVKIVYSICMSCHREFISNDQIITNENTTRKTFKN